MEKVESVFKNKNYVLTFLGNLVTTIGSLFYSFTISFYILSITNNNAVIQGTYLAVGGIVFLVFSIPAGVICDRFNKAKVMYICDLVRGGMIFASVYFIYFFKESVTGQLVVLFAMNCISNIIGAIFNPAASALMPEILKEDQIQQGQSYFSIVNSFQSIIGILLAGVFYSILPFTVLLILIASAYILSGFSEMFIRYKHVKPETKMNVKTMFTDLGDALKYLKGEKAMVVFTFAILILNFFFAPYSDNFMTYFVATDVASTPNYLFSSFLTPELWSSLATIAFSIGGIIAGIVLSQRKTFKTIHKIERISLVIVVSILGIIAISYLIFVNKTQNLNIFLIILLIMSFLMGVSITTINVPISSFFTTHCRKDMLGKFFALLNVGSQGLVPIAVFVGGVLLNSFGSAFTLFYCTIGAAIMVVFVLFNKSINDL